MAVGIGSGSVNGSRMSGLIGMRSASMGQPVLSIVPPPGAGALMPMGDWSAQVEP